jgi:hypothetical protein
VVKRRSFWFIVTGTLWVLWCEFMAWRCKRSGVNCCEHGKRCWFRTECEKRKMTC